MKVQYNREDDVLMLFLSEDPIDHAQEVDGLIAHFSADDRPVLFEILDASDFLARLGKIAATAPSGESVAV